MARMKQVRVGNGMAGMRTLEELLKAAPDMYDITVFGDEPHPNYNRIMLSPVLAGEQTVEQIVLNSRDWYAECGMGSRWYTSHPSCWNATARVRAVRFKDNKKIPADLVNMAVGIRQNTQLAESAGLLVNDTIQTAHLCGGRMRQPSRHHQRTGDTVLGAGQGLRQSSGRAWRGARSGFDDFEQIESHRLLHGRRRACRNPRRDRRTELQDFAGKHARTGLEDS